MTLDFPIYYAPDAGAATASSDTDASADDASTDDVSAGETAGEESADSAPTPETGDAADQDWDIDTLRQKGELNDAMAQVGGNLNRDETGEADPESVRDQDETGAAAESEEEGEEDATAEETAEDDETLEEEEETADVDATEDELEEGEEEEESREDSGEPLPEPIQDTVQELYPERVVENTEQLRDAIEADRESTQMVSVIDQLLAEDPHLEKYMELRLQGDHDPRAAALRSMEELVTAPDPDEDPEAYADWKVERQQKESDQEQEAAEEEQVSEEVETFRRQTKQSFDAYQQKHGLSDEELADFEKRVNTLVFGDENGNVPRDQAHRLARAVFADQYVHEEEVEQRIEEARKEARNNAIEEMQENKKGDGLPKPGGSREPTGEKDVQDEELQQLGESFESRSVNVDDFAV